MEEWTELEKFLSSIDIPKDEKIKVENALLQKRKIDNIEYSNFMEEVAVRVRQSIQPLSGSLAELCVEFALKNEGLKLNEDYDRRKKHTDFTIYYIKDKNKTHRIEVKNVSLRERGSRGLKFDGDSLAGFFNQEKEFTKENISIIDDSLNDTKGYCYVPSNILNYILSKGGKRFKDINKLGEDMKYFNLNGLMP